MSAQAIATAARLGVVVDLQPAWLYLDAKTLSAQFGDARLRYFQPLHSLFEAGVIAGGGSDHMQKIGSLEEGKQADFVVLDRDLLTCPEGDIREARALATYLDGKRVFERRD